MHVRNSAVACQCARNRKAGRQATVVATWQPEWGRLRTFALACTRRHTPRIAPDSFPPVHTVAVARECRVA